jgi:hypothetical protein
MSSEVEFAFPDELVIVMYAGCSPGHPLTPGFCLDVAHRLRLVTEDRVRGARYRLEKPVADAGSPPAGADSACDHAGSLVQVRTPPNGSAPVLSWCSRCGALKMDGEWLRPDCVPAEKYGAAVRDRDAMCETLTTAQERGTALVEEVRLLRARLARFGG